MRFIVTQDKTHADKIRKALRENDGYCPCRITKDESSRCVCEDFIKNIKSGEYCHCGLYKKVEE